MRFLAFAVLHRRPIVQQVASRGPRLREVHAIDPARRKGIPVNAHRTDQSPGSGHVSPGTSHAPAAGASPGALRDPGPVGPVNPGVQALISALDAIDGACGREGADSTSQAWGTGGLGADQVSEADIEELARSHHRLTAQIGRLVRGPVSTAPVPMSAGSLVQPDPGGDPDPTPGSEPTPDNKDHAPGGDADGDRPALPFGAQSTLVRRGWRPGQARTVIAAARFAVRFPEVDQMWRAGDISAEAVFALYQTCRKLTDEQEGSFMAIMLDHLHDLTFPQLSRLTGRVLDLIRPDDIDKDDKSAYQARSLTFSTLGDTVLFQGQLPKLEGQAFQDTITAIAEQQRAEEDLLTPGQRRADALTELIVSSSLAGNTPSLGGLPVAVTLTLNLDQAENVTSGEGGSSDTGIVNVNTRFGGQAGGSHPGAGALGLGPGPDRRATYPDGDVAGTATTRFALCCAEVTPITCANNPSEITPSTGNPGARAVVDTTGFDEPGRTRSNDRTSLRDRLIRSPQLPLAIGRTQRLATPAQRKALAVRDAGCVIAGCDVQPNRTQPHHVTDYSLGGPTDLENLASLCWVHHRQVDHHLWRLTPNDQPGTSPFWTAERELAHSR